LPHCRRVNEDSILAIQIFDQKKFKKKDQGFLGVINVRIGDVIDLQMGGDGKLLSVTPIIFGYFYLYMFISADILTGCLHRDAHQRPEEIQ
jgi:hypothetical protein